MAISPIHSSPGGYVYTYVTRDPTLCRAQGYRSAKDLGFGFLPQGLGFSV